MGSVTMVLFFLGLSAVLLWPESGVGENMWWANAGGSCTLQALGAGESHVGHIV